MTEIDTQAIQTRLSQMQKPALAVGAVGLVLVIVGAIFDLEQFWQSYLLGFMFWLEVALGCLGLVMLHHLVGGRWGLPIRRLLETGAMTLPLLAIFFIPLLLGLGQLYSWTDAEFMAESELLQHKSGYLNIPFFLARAIIFFIVWLGLAFLLNRWSLEQDQTGSPSLTGRMRRLSAVGIILYVVTSTFAAYDWMMSLEPEWFSSIYGLLFIAGQALAALTLAIIGLRFISRNRSSTEVVAGVAWFHHFNDLGNLLLGFTMIWAYFTFSQFLIIWSANIPEEAVWYAHRGTGGWLGVGIFLILLHFVLPFLVLLSRRAKRTAPLLTVVALVIFLMRLVDLYWLIVPAFYPDGIHVHWLDFAVPIAMGGVWGAIFARQLAQKALLPLHDPRLEEIVKHEQNEELVVP